MSLILLHPFSLFHCLFLLFFIHLLFVFSFLLPSILFFFFFFLSVMALLSSPSSFTWLVEFIWYGCPVVCLFVRISKSPYFCLSVRVCLSVCPFTAVCFLSLRTHSSLSSIGLFCYSPVSIFVCWCVFHLFCFAVCSVCQCMYECIYVSLPVCISI